MQVYFDESGSFDPSPGRAENLCFVLGVVVPENAEARLKDDIDWFVSNLVSSERYQGEPKGALLSLRHRGILLEIIKSHRDVMLVPVSVNLAQTEPEFLQQAPSRIRALIESNLGVDSPHFTVPERRELAKRIGNLSAPVLARIFSYAIGVFRTIEAFAVYYVCEKFHTQYDSIRVIFDRAAAPNSREELVFRESLFGWVANWSARAPIQTDPRLNLLHPLGGLYGEERNGKLTLDLRKMLHGRIEFQNSKESWQIRLANFIANTWARVVLDYEGESGLRPLFRDLNRKTALTKGCLGLAGLTDNLEVVAGPQYLNVFPEMIHGDTKITPCD